VLDEDEETDELTLDLLEGCAELELDTTTELTLELFTLEIELELDLELGTELFTELITELALLTLDVTASQTPWSLHAFCQAHPTPGAYGPPIVHQPPTRQVYA
jgi:hypothetical protein